MFFKVLLVAFTLSFTQKSAASSEEYFLVGIYKSSFGVIETNMHPTLIIPKTWLLELLGEAVNRPEYLLNTNMWYLDFGTKTGLDSQNSATGEWIAAHRQKGAVFRLTPTITRPMYKIFKVPVTADQKHALLTQIGSWIAWNGAIEPRDNFRGGVYLPTNRPWRLDPASLPRGASIGIDADKIKREAPLAQGEHQRNCVSFIVEMLKAVGVLGPDENTLLAYSPNFAFWTGATLDSLLTNRLQIVEKP